MQKGTKYEPGDPLRPNRFFPVVALIYFGIGSLPTWGYTLGLGLDDVDLTGLWTLIVVGLLAYLIGIKFGGRKREADVTPTALGGAISIAREGQRSILFASFAVLVGGLATYAGYKMNGFIPIFADNVDEARFFFKTPPYVGPLYSLNVVAAAFTTLTIMRNRRMSPRMVFAGILLAANVFLIIALGSRTGLLFALGCPILAYSYLVKRLTLRRLAVFALVGFLGFSFLSVLRNSGGINGVSGWLETQDAFFLGSPYLSLIYEPPRFTLETMQVFFENIPNPIPPFHGAFIGVEFLTLLPGFKVNANMLTIFFFDSVGLWAESGRPPGIFGVGYADFLLPGVIVYLLSWGLVLGKSYRRLVARPGLRRAFVHSFLLLWLTFGLYGMGIPNVEFFVELSIFVVAAEYISARSQNTPMSWVARGFVLLLTIVGVSSSIYQLVS